MRWVAVLLVWLSAALCACGRLQPEEGWGETDTATTGGPDDPGGTSSGTGEPPPQQLKCSQTCAKVAPATYTGPSLFWLGSPMSAPGCPSVAPYMGLAGFVKGAAGSPFAFECLVTPSASCEDEGLTCMPSPQDFQICIHHDEDSACAGDYTEKHVMSDMESGLVLTVCCEKPGPP